jgi:hypothetical protein
LSPANAIFLFIVFSLIQLIIWFLQLFIMYINMYKKISLQYTVFPFWFYQFYTHIKFTIILNWSDVDFFKQEKIQFSNCWNDEKQWETCSLSNYLLNYQCCFIILSSETYLHIKIYYFFGNYFTLSTLIKQRFYQQIFTILRDPVVFFHL